jgi:folate-dependent phosphoribosylglycinamide formyltransferase PurN
MPAGTYTNRVEILNHETLQAEVLVPKDAMAGQTVHIVLEATDTGSPALTQYQRIVLEIRNR